MLGAASFNAQKPEEYFLARDVLGECCAFQLTHTYSDPVTFTAPPADVMGYLFPWVEDELEALDKCVVQSYCNKDFALQQFLQLLQWRHLVLVQDCALLHAQYPQCPMFCFAPFTFPSFTAFSANAVALVAAVEEKAQLAFHTLPEHMARSMCGYATDLQMKQELNHSMLQDQLQELQRQTAHLTLLIMLLVIWCYICLYNAPSGLSPLGS